MFLVQRFKKKKKFRKGELTSCLANRVTSPFMLMTRKVGKRTSGFCLRRSFGLVLSRNLCRLADTYKELTWFHLNYLNLVHANISGKRATGIRIADVKSESFSFHSPHDIQCRSVIPQIYCGIKLLIWREAEQINAFDRGNRVTQ